MSFDNLSLEIAAEFAGHRGAREYFGADGYSFRRLGTLTDADFEHLTALLRNKKWKRDHPEACRRHKAESERRLMLADPAGQRVGRQRRKKRWQAKNPERVKAMAVRGYLVQLAKDPIGYRQRALSRAKAHYQQTKADPAKAEALRVYKREWARKKARAA